MSTHQHILCVTDFSQYSDRACAKAVELAEVEGARLTLLHVIEHFPGKRSNEVIVPENRDPKSFREEQAKSALGEQAARLHCKDAQLAVSISDHSAAHAISHYAAKSDVDLIVVGSHEHRGIERLLGDKADEIRKHAKCEVRVVPSN
jgi:universal stress protein A